MANMNKLRGKIIENGKNIEEMAIAIGVNRSTFYRKLAEEGQTFSIREADAIVKELALTNSEAATIFFTHYVA